MLFISLIIFGIIMLILGWLLVLNHPIFHPLLKTGQTHWIRNFGFLFSGIGILTLPLTIYPIPFLIFIWLNISICSVLVFAYNLRKQMK